LRLPDGVRCDGYAERVKLRIGDLVVYPAYGVGRIAAREERLVLGVKSEILVLELAEGLSVTLSVEHADRVLRPVLSEADMVRVQKALRDDQALSDDGWLKRKRDVQAKVVGGDPAEMAEVVRNGARRERARQEKNAGAQLSPSERDLYVRARRLLSSEIGSARGLNPDAADAWIDEQLGTGSV
jgi:CarD family transcriptional regulator